MNALLFAAAVAASNSVATLPTVIVEASRLDQSKYEIAAQVEVIGKDEIDASGAENTVALLEKRANLFIRKQNANPAEAQVSMRGYGANGFGRVKILVDGVALNNADMSPQNLMRVPVRSIRKIEILHGPQTVLHGGEASAGVINILSDTETNERKTELEIHGGNLGAVGIHAGTGGGLEAEGLTYYADFDYDRADGWRRNSWYELWSVKGGLKQRFDNGAWWAMNLFYSDSQYGLPGGLYTGGTYGSWKSRAREADDTTSKARNDVYGLSLSGKGVIDDENTVSAEFSFRNRKSESYDYLEYDVYTFDYKLKYTNLSPVFVFDNQLDCGADLRHDLLYAYAYDAGKNPYGADNDFIRFSGAVFVRDEFWLLEELSIFGGVRGEGLNLRNQCDLKGGLTSETETKSAVAGEVGVNWQPMDDFKVFAKWSRFYHAPLADEMFSSYGIANLALKPEAGHNTEIGFDWTLLKDFAFAFTGYHTELEDELMYLNSSNCNAPDHTARSGFETSLTWLKNKVGSAGVMYNYCYARFTEGDYRNNELPMVPRQQLRLFGEYYLLEEIALHGGCRFVGAQRYGSDFANEGGKLPSYTIFDLGLRVMPSWRRLSGYTFAFTIDNLFDKRYCDYGEYFGSHYVYPACGRTFMFTIRYEF